MATHTLSMSASALCAGAVRATNVLDQVLDLIDTDIEYVTAAAHKRRWFDVTNADHTRVTVRSDDRAEAVAGNRSMRSPLEGLKTR